MKQPNVVFLFADQQRAQATGYAGDPNVRTPILDSLAKESVNFSLAVSGCPVCSPYRASLLTGQYPLTHGVFLNDVCLRPKGTTLAEAFRNSGYDTAYIGKWHLDGHGRSNYIPPERRCGFDYWKVLECTHDYPHSPYYGGDSPKKVYWNGYDALAQTRDAQEYIRQNDGKKPFLLMLSWGPPHNPYETAPPEFRQLYSFDEMVLPPNVPEKMASAAREWLAGYYAHCSALDYCVGEILKTLHDQGIEEETLFVCTSDHGDMLGSQGEVRKQRPWDESIRVPFLLKYPALDGWKPRSVDALIDAPDIMPTLLGLCGIPIPATVQGIDFLGYISGGHDPSEGEALIMCPHPFGEWTKQQHGGKEFRGLRTGRYTYVRDLAGPWLLYDNQNDPYQLKNLVRDCRFAEEREDLERRLQRKLASIGDQFLPGAEYVREWGYTVDANGTVPTTH